MSASRAVARELRAELARQQMGHTELAQRVSDHVGRDVSAAWVSRRMTGNVPIDLDEIQALCLALELDLEHLLTVAGVIRERRQAS